MKYQPSEIEPKWQQAWDQDRVYEISNDIDVLKQKPKYYVLDMFPYPSGAGLHVGHPEGYTATDVMGRMRRMQGYNVLHPMGWDAFGLPAERAAVRENIHPAVITKRNTDNFRAQLKRLGFAYDWSREVSTTDPNYYKWTQWIFLKLYEKDLAYLAEVPVNWCPALGTVLANEEVKDGVYVETGDPVERRSMKQWMLKITAYAERLLEDLDGLDWPESIKDMQRHWIGKSRGASIQFSVDGHDAQFEVYTTRPDTLMGATYCVLAPEHALVSQIVSPEQASQVSAYVEEAKNKSDLLRTDLAKEKTGVFTGAYAVHPVSQKPVPIWIADYVLASYGTGAIMAVPAHDERDHAFATQFGLPIIQVVSGAEKPIEEAAYTGDGSIINSDFLDGLSVDDAKEKMISHLQEQGTGKAEVQYRLRDWLFSRQRYWGEPFPLLHTEDGEVLPIDATELPITLPEIDQYKPTADGQPPLGRAEDWVEVLLPDGRKARRELNTMPQWAGSCWYYLRYIDPNNSEAAWNKELENYWMPIDLYVGGVEHAVLHLLYARFWHKVLYDCGLVSTKEPFQKLFNQGMILAYSYQDAKGKYISPEAIDESGDQPVIKDTGEIARKQVEKMSKSKMNVVNPDDVVRAYGADALRLYELFMGPLEATKPWQTKGVEGVHRFLQRAWRLVVNEESGGLSDNVDLDAAPDCDISLQKSLHKMLKKVHEDTEGMRFNTAISAMMSFVNDATGAKTRSGIILADFLKVLAPYAPHLAQELWQRLGNEGYIVDVEWPSFDPALVVDDSVTIVLQVNGKKRGSLDVAMNDATDKAALEKMALADTAIQKHLEGRTPKRVIAVPKRLVNIVI